MPFKSFRQEAIESAQRTLRAATALLLLGRVNGNISLIHIEDPRVFCYYLAKKRLERVVKSRYATDRTCRKSPIQNVFEDDLEENEDGTHWLNDFEFKRKYRCSRNALDRITNEIKGNDVFKKRKRGPPQMPVKHQLMTLLHFLGSEAESNSKQRNIFKISNGRCEKNRGRCVTALNSLRDKYIFWPDADERKVISKRIEKKFFLPNMVAMMDGTLLPLGICPSSDDAADYSGRKFR